MIGSQLVSVVIPAYNAAATIGETLRSVQSQTHHELEIIVVDDGSTDNTRMVVNRHSAVDNRIRVVTQDNQGVAAARNNGWHRARSDLIAFVDADDLWGPTKIQRQLQALQVRDSQVGLVYCWFMRIDSQGLITSFGKQPHFEGDVLHQLFIGNFIGNGSCALVRRQALLDAGGFDSSLRAADSEGCEDLLFYLRVAERYHFAVVPEYLVGYRYLPNNMSSNRLRMARSWLLVVEVMLARHPGQAHALKRGLYNYFQWITRDLLSNNLGQLWRVLLLMIQHYPSKGLMLLLKDIPITLMLMTRCRLIDLYRGEQKLIQAETGQRFIIGDEG